MAMQAKTVRLIEVAVEILTAQHPMTVRQVYYQLVSRQDVLARAGGFTLSRRYS